jgi:hypothetical protein
MGEVAAGRLRSRLAPRLTRAWQGAKILRSRVREIAVNPPDHYIANRRSTVVLLLNNRRSCPVGVALDYVRSRGPCEMSMFGSVCVVGFSLPEKPS